MFTRWLMVADIRFLDENLMKTLVTDRGHSAFSVDLFTGVGFARGHDPQRRDTRSAPAAGESVVRFNQSVISVLRQATLSLRPLPLYFTSPFVQLWSTTSRLPARSVCVCVCDGCEAPRPQDDSELANVYTNLVKHVHKTSSILELRRSDSER